MRKCIALSYSHLFSYITFLLLGPDITCWCPLSLNLFANFPGMVVDAYDNKGSSNNDIRYIASIMDGVDIREDLC